MDTLIEFVSQSILVDSGAAMVLLATLPAVLFLKGDRTLRCSAVAMFAGAVALILLGVEGVIGAVVIVTAEVLVVSALMLAMRKRQAQLEASLDAARAAIRALEITEERRQVFSARAATEYTSSNLNQQEPVSQPFNTD